MGLGVLQWTPEAFWNAVPSELDAAIEGWNEKNGATEKPEPMTSERLHELMEEYGCG